MDKMFLVQISADASPGLKACSGLVSRKTDIEKEMHGSPRRFLSCLTSLSGECAGHRRRAFLSDEMDAYTLSMSYLTIILMRTSWVPYGLISKRDKLNSFAVIFLAVSIHAVHCSRAYIPQYEYMLVGKVGKNSNHEIQI
jgi:hypothetical protein